MCSICDGDAHIHIYACLWVWDACLKAADVLIGFGGVEIKALCSEVLLSFHRLTVTTAVLPPLLPPLYSTPLSFSISATSHLYLLWLFPASPHPLFSVSALSSTLLFIFSLLSTLCLYGASQNPQRPSSDLNHASQEWFMHMPKLLFCYCCCLWQVIITALRRLHGSSFPFHPVLQLIIHCRL